jgi:hypothetical protein
LHEARVLQAADQFGERDLRLDGASGAPKQMWTHHIRCFLRVPGAFSVGSPLPRDPLPHDPSYF